MRAAAWSTKQPGAWSMVFRQSERAWTPGIFHRLASSATPLAVALLLAGCAAAPARNPLATWAPSPNVGERRAQLIVLHFTGDASVQHSLKTLSTPNGGNPVSAHYVIGGDGHIYQLVADSMRAWHAGVGRWGTMTDVNSASIGIELDNDGSVPFASAQIDSLLRLLAEAQQRRNKTRIAITGRANTHATADALGVNAARTVASGTDLYPRHCQAAVTRAGRYHLHHPCRPPPGSRRSTFRPSVGFAHAANATAIRPSRPAAACIGATAQIPSVSSQHIARRAALTAAAAHGHIDVQFDTRV
ncbi:MAG: hypothetical protein WDW36_008398 [Sanguina aurantia]